MFDQGHRQLPSGYFFGSMTNPTIHKILTTTPLRRCNGVGTGWTRSPTSQVSSTNGNNAEAEEATRIELNDPKMLSSSRIAMRYQQNRCNNSAYIDIDESCAI